MRTRSAFAAWVAAVGLAGGASVAAAERPWIELASPHFVVVSNAGEKEASRTAWQFEQVRSVFRNLWPWARTRRGSCWTRPAGAASSRACTWLASLPKPK